jgi:predicted molibdopterin-dependent oxidoreductase YjgC
MRQREAIKILSAIMEKDGSLNNNMPRIHWIYGTREVLLNGKFDVSLIEAIATYVQFMNKPKKQ